MKRFFRVLWRLARTLILIAAVLWGLNYLAVTLVRDGPTCPLCGGGHLIHDYYTLTGISRECVGNGPDTTVQIYGEPLSVDYEFTGDEEHPGFYRMLYNYDEFSIMFGTTDATNYSYLGFVLYSENRWLRWDIHVGSSREQIIHAYRKCIPCTDDGELGNGYFNVGHRSPSETSVQFTYDENEVVTSIRCYPIPPL